MRGDDGRQVWRRALVALLAAAALGVTATGCGGDDDSGDVPSGAVATVGDVEISGDDLDEQVEILARAQRGGSGGGGSAAGKSASGNDDDAAAKQLRKQLEAQALSMILMREALEQEAAERDIEVSDTEVRQRWETAAKAQFKTKKALERFLGGQSEDDLLAQLRLQLLAERIHQQVSEKAGGGKAGAKAVKQFQKDFQKRWADRTACADGYSAAGCADDKSSD